MSANNTISIRLEVTGDAASVSKITNVLNGFKGLKAGVEDARTSMQKQWSTGSLTGLGAAIGQTQTQAVTLKTRLTEIGGTLASNASAFGVATASVWGVYNAYDSLVKVEIRAETAMNRVSTMTTTLATLEQRLAEARQRGNLTAEEMAILEQRITDTKAKLATAQERSADLQGDVNEAWGAFASQVGPQVVAAGGSIVQLYTNMRGSLTGIVPKIKDFISNLSLGGSSAKTMAAGISPLASAMGDIGPKAKSAATGISALSGAMKGLLLGGGIAAGIFAIGTAIAYFRDQQIDAIINSKLMTDALATSESAMESFADTTTKAQETLDLVVKSFGDDFQKIIDKAKEMSVSVNLAAVTADLAKQKTAIVDLNGPITALKEKYMEITKNANFFDIITGKLTEAQKKLEEQITNLTDTQNKHGEQIKTDTALIERLKAAIMLKKGVQDEDTKFVLEAVVAGVSLKDAWVLLNTVTEGGTKSLNTHKDAILANNEEMKTGADLAKEWLFATAGKVDTDRAMKEELIKYAQTLGITGDLQSKDIEQIKQMIQQKLGWIKATDDQIQAAKDYDKYQEDIVKGNIAASIAQAQAANAVKEHDADLRASVAGILSYTDANKLSTEELLKVAPIIGAVTVPIHDQFTALVQGAGAWDNYGTAAFEADKAMQQQTFSMIKVNEILEFSQKNQLLYNQAQIQGRLNAQAFFTTQKLGQITAEQYRRDLIANAGETLKYADTNKLLTSEIEGLISRAMLPLQEQLILTEREMETARDSTLQFFDSLLGAETGKDFNKAWKELDLGSIPKKLKDDFKDMAEAFREPTERGREVATALQLVSLNAMGLGDNLSKSEISKTFKEISKDFKEFATTDLEATTLLEKAPKLFDDLATGGEKFHKTQVALTEAMKDGNITGEELNTILTEYGKATGEAVTPTQELSAEQQKIADNNTLARTIVQVTTNFETQTKVINLQGRAVRGLTLDFGNLVKIMKEMQAVKTSGGDNSNGFTQIYAEGPDPNNPFYDPKAHPQGDGIQFKEFEKKDTGDIDDQIAKQTELQVALQKTQTALANLANEGSNSLMILAKNSSVAMKGMSNNLKVGDVASFSLQTELANLSNEGVKSLAALASASSKAAQGIRNNLNVAYTASTRLQTNLANLANQGSASLAKLASASSSSMNGFVNNLKKGETAVKNLKSAIDSLKNKTVHIGLTGPGVKFLAQGFHGVVDKPTLFVAGEAGPERVDVSPTVSRGTGLEFNDVRKLKVEPVGNLQAGSRLEREVIRERGGTGPQTIQINMSMFPGGEIIKKLVMQLPLDDTGMYGTA